MTSMRRQIADAVSKPAKMSREELVAEHKGTQMMYRIDVAGQDLRGLDLSHAMWEECSFAGADLRGANLVGATMDYCDARGANMADAVVSEGFEAPEPGDDRWDKWNEGESGKKPSRVASLRGARLVGATLPENMQGVDLVDADMGGIDLCKRHMEGADFL